MFALKLRCFVAILGPIRGLGAGLGRKKNHPNGVGPVDNIPSVSTKPKEQTELKKLILKINRTFFIKEK